MLDIDKLIEAVQRRPALYDATSKDYSDRNKKAKYWEEVGEEVYDDWNDVSPSQKCFRERHLLKKWKALRDNFVRDYKVLSETGSLKKKKYIFYDQLTFLIPFIKHGDKASANGSGVDGDHQDQGERMLSTLWDELSAGDLNGQSVAGVVVVKDEHDGDGEPRRKSRRRDTSETCALEMPEPKEEPDDRHGNRAFLLSYVPMMDRMTYQNQLHARMMITQVFYDLQQAYAVAQDTVT